MIGSIGSWGSLRSLGLAGVSTDRQNIRIGRARNNRLFPLKKLLKRKPRTGLRILLLATARKERPSRECKNAMALVFGLWLQRTKEPQSVKDSSFPADR